MSELNLQSDPAGLPPVDDSRYPNLSMLTKGCISGRISEWPFLKQEANLALRRIAQLEQALRDMRFAYVNKDEDAPHGFELSAIEKCEQLVGPWGKTAAEMRQEMFGGEVSL